MTFFLPCDHCDPSYKAIRDDDRGKEYKKDIEYLWKAYAPYADSHFLSDARLHFQERFWEMYLGNTFLDNQFKISAGTSKGPEFYFDIDGRKCWIEAIAPGPGNGPDAVPEMEHGKTIANRVPSNEIILRLRSAIFDKQKAYLRSLEDGIIQENDLYVLAINSKRIRPCIGGDELPYIVKAVYPFGNLVAVFNKNTSQIVDTHHEYREKIKKSSGSVVDTDIFLKKEYSGIRGGIYSEVDAVNRPQKLGSDFRLVHNLMSKNPLPKGSFKFGVEYWVRNDELNFRSWE